MIHIENAVILDQNDKQQLIERLQEAHVCLMAAVMAATANQPVNQEKCSKAAIGLEKIMSSIVSGINTSPAEKTPGYASEEDSRFGAEIPKKIVMAVIEDVQHRAFHTKNFPGTMSGVAFTDYIRGLYPEYYKTLKELKAAIA